jgi:signal transduction histidine kinase
MRVGIAAGGVIGGGAATALAEPSVADPVARTLEGALSGLDPLALILLGVVLVLPAVLGMRLRLRAEFRARSAAEAGAERLRASLMAAPDGVFAWIDGREMCSRRLAVLLGLGEGTAAGFPDVLEAFAPRDAARLDGAVTALRVEADGFSLDLTTRDGGRRVRAVGVRGTDEADPAAADLIWMRDISEDSAEAQALTERLVVQAQARARLEGLVAALPVPVWVRDDDLALVEVNRAYAQAVEAVGPEAVVVGQTELASNGAVRETRALAARARAAGGPRSETFHLVLAGERRFAEITETPFEADGRLLTAGLLSDLTRVETMQAELDRHLAAHAGVLQHLATAIAIFDPDTRLGFFNTAFVRLWRLDGDWLAGRPTYGTVLDVLRDRRMLPEMVDYRAFKEAEIKRFISLIDPAETLLHLPDGRTLRQMIAAHPQGGLIFTYEDVTDSLALERSFNTMLAVQRETLDHLHEGVAVFRADGRLRLSNPAFARIWALSPEQLAGEPSFTEVVEAHRRFFDDPSDDRAGTWPEMRDRLASLINERAPRRGRLYRLDDSIVDYASVPLPDGAMLLTWLDVTDSARVERALRERNEALAAADQLKSAFIADVSAEVKKPLASIVGLAEMLASEFVGPLDQRQGAHARAIAEAGQGLAALISDILDLAAIEAGQMRLELDTLDLHPMLASVLGLLRERLRAKSLTLDFDCPLDIGWIVADERRIKQVVFSLLGNAIAVTAPGGRIAVRVERRRGEVRIAICDSEPGPGPGEPSASVEAALSAAPPSAAPPSASVDEPGLRLGLALVGRFVGLHGGQVEVESVPGAGNTVLIRLPTGTAAA